MLKTQMFFLFKFFKFIFYYEKMYFTKHRHLLKSPRLALKG